MNITLEQALSQAQQFAVSAGETLTVNINQAGDGNNGNDDDIDDDNDDSDGVETFELKGKILRKLIITKNARTVTKKLKIKKLTKGEPLTVVLSTTRPDIISFSNSTVSFGNRKGNKKVRLTFASFLDILETDPEFEESSLLVPITVTDDVTGYSETAQLELF